MQRTSRRLIASRASISSRSQASTRIRRSSRTSSAGGDYVPASRDSHRFSDLSDIKSKLRSSKCNSNLQQSKKLIKVSKGQKPTYKSLHNAVVLTPFYTLKRHFQSKLVDMYSQEKVKKQTNKMKLAQSQNVSFEYDVVALKPSLNKCKKREKVTKKKFESVRAKNKRNSGNADTASYCQCDEGADVCRGTAQRNVLQGVKSVKRGIRTRMMCHPTCPAAGQSGPFRFPSSAYPCRGSKKMRLQTDDFYGLPEHCSGHMGPGPSTSMSNVSSKADSWDTFSESHSLKDEHLEGSLAISMTSFDSCLEQVGGKYNRGNSAETKSRKYKCSTRYQLMDQIKEGCSGGPSPFRPKPQVRDSRNLIMSDDTKNSDERISDFMDREPQARGINNSEFVPNLQPLQRVSKTKTKKQGNDPSPPPNNYYLRSSKEDTRSVGQLKRSSNTFDVNRHGPTTSQVSRRHLSSHVKRPLSRNGDDSVEGLSLDERRPRGVDTGNGLPPPQADDRRTAEEPGPGTENQTQLLFLRPTVEETYSQTEDLNQSSGSRQVVGEPSRTRHDIAPEVLSRESVLPRKSVTSQTEQNTALAQSQMKLEKMTAEPRQRDSETDKVGERRRSERNATAPATDTKDPIQRTDLMPEPLPMTEEEFKGQVSDNSTGAGNQPGDADSAFIFGPRNTSAGMGEYCKYSFGLNFVLSDDDDSEHGDRFL